MKSILFIIPYFGKWPLWFDAHLISIAKNETINWLFLTDCKIPTNKPPNVKFVQSSLLDFNAEINKVVGFKVPLHVRKICDMRPAFGDIFKEQLLGYDFWGFCDVDIIWGDIRKYVTSIYLDNYDCISSLNGMLSGHFTIVKNSKKNNQLYKYENVYKTKFLDPKHTIFDEYGFTSILKECIKQKKTKVYWGKEIDSVSHQEYYLDKWQWQHGKMIDVTTNEEVMYLHFINWKRFMKICEVNYLDNPTQFYISYNRMHYNKHSKTTHILNAIKNVFNGYWVKEKRRIRKLNLKSYKKRVIRKLT